MSNVALVQAATSAMKMRRPRRFSLAVGLVILVLMLLLSLFPGFFAPYDPLVFDYQHLSAAPTLAHPFGTDNFGRDVLSRVIWATRVDLQIALFCTLFPLIFGTIIGALIGFYGGWLDAVFGRLVYLSSLRTQDSGLYEHHGLAQMFGAEQTAETLRRRGQGDHPPGLHPEAPRRGKG